MTPKKTGKAGDLEVCFEGSQRLLRCVAQSSQKIKRLKDLHVVGSWYNFISHLHVHFTTRIRETLSVVDRGKSVSDLLKCFANPTPDYRIYEKGKSEKKTKQKKKNASATNQIPQ